MCAAIYSHTKVMLKEDDQAKRNLIFAIFLLVILYVIGIFFYHNVEGWSFIDAAYFLTATFSTVGYGDITPHTELGKLFTMLILWVGISVGFFLIYSMMAYRETAIDEKLLGKLRLFGTLTSRDEKKK